MGLTQNSKLKTLETFATLGSTKLHLVARTQYFHPYGELSTLLMVFNNSLAV